MISRVVSLTSALGLGPGYQYNHVLEMVIPALTRYRGMGPELVQTALVSRVIRVRRAALRAPRALSCGLTPPRGTPPLLKSPPSGNDTMAGASHLAEHANNVSFPRCRAT
jgi:hypothetical protein